MHPPCHLQFARHNQTVRGPGRPDSGIGGTLLVVRALQRRSIEEAAAVSVLPGGVGAFEVGSVVLLRVLSIPLEAALTATLLLRGLTLWLPMLPGLWLARREVAGA